MKMRVLFLFFPLVFATLSHADAPSQSTLSSSHIIETDLDGDGIIERISLHPRRDQTLEIRHGAKLVWSGIPKEWKPWKLTVADVDGNGTREIILGVYKSTKYFPNPHNCLFIYDWNGTQARKKWLGSSLSKPFTDFVLADLKCDGRAELVALETLEDGRFCIVSYSWNGFGWASDWQRGQWKKAQLLGVEKGKIKVEADGQIFIFGDQS